MDVHVHNMEIMWDEINRWKSMFLMVSIASMLIIAPLLMLTQPFLMTAAIIIMKIVAAPLIDIPIYIDCC